MNYTITPVKNGLKGTIKVGGDKSISHRALLLGAIANGTTEIIGLSTNVDVQTTKKCLQQLGVLIEKQDDKTIVHGVNLTGFRKPKLPINAGNSGTTLRLICGLLAGQNFSVTLTGDKSLRKRPMDRIIKPLQQMGAQIKSSSTGKTPISITGSNLRSISYRTPVASAQVKSCILLAGLYAQGITSITEPYQSRDHTEKMLPDFGIPVQQEGLKISVKGKAQPIAATIDVPGDISSSAFFIIAATLIPNSNLVIKHVGLNPTRIGLLEILKKMGANVSINYLNTSQSEPIGNLTITSATLQGITIKPAQIPQLIDELPIIAIAAVCARGRTVVTGAKELRVKESDRLKAITINLQAMGIKIQEENNGFIINGPQTFHGATIESFFDHRIAMAFSIAGLLAEGKTIIKNAECVSISMPEFFDMLERVKRE